MTGRIVIVGAGLAGVCCAEALRAAGYGGRVGLIGEEPGLPYDRPPLSKEWLELGSEPMPIELRPSSWFQDQSIDPIHGRVVSIDRAAGVVRLADGAELPWDQLVLALGVQPRTIVLAEGHGPQPLTLRTPADSRALRQRLQARERICVVGGGLIGMEIAAAARQAGCEVTVVERSRRLMERVMPASLSAFCEDLHRARGVDLRLGAQLHHMAWADGVFRLQVDDTEAEADAVVVAIGADPRVALAEAAGLAVGNGIHVDAFGRTSDPRIWATGDCAAMHPPVLDTRVRFEQWHHARSHAMRVGRNMAGAPQPYGEWPLGWSTQFGHHMQMVGSPQAGDQEVWRGDPRMGRALLFCLRGDRIVGAYGIDAARDMRQAKAFLTEGTAVSVQRLADPAVPLDQART